MTPPTKEELEAAFCWEADDQIPRRPAMTAFRRAARYHQARWREANRHPIGTQPIVAEARRHRSGRWAAGCPSTTPARPGANFLTPAALDAARARTAYIEPRQSFDHQRLWADLLSSSALSFNLFGDLAADLARADRAVHRWFPDAPGRVSEVRFAHSPGWFDPAYLNSLRSFDAVFILDLDDGSRGIVAVDVKYHERNKSETPRPENHRRATARSPSALRCSRRARSTTLKRRSDLCVLWLEHLLLFSMLQHPSDNWTWGRYLVVHPAGNTDIVDLCGRYRTMLADDATFTTMTLEQLLATGALPRPTIAALRDRYVARVGTLADDDRRWVDGDLAVEVADLRRRAIPGGDPITPALVIERLGLAHDFPRGTPHRHFARPRPSR